jgi:hypothetical protein
VAWIRSTFTPPRRTKQAEFLFGFGLAATVILFLVFMVSHPRASRPSAQVPENRAAESTIVEVPEKPIDQKMDVIVATEPITHTHASNSLAQADETEFRGSVMTHPALPPVKAVTTATSETTSAPPSSTHYDFYLEHGTPMPPESRGGKSAY